MGGGEFMKKIICFTDSLGSGGAQRQLVGLAIMLKERGHNVSVVLYHDIPFYSDVLIRNNIQIEIIKTGSNPIKRILKFRKYFKSKKANWVIAYQETPSLVATVCRLLGCNYRLIVSERNTTQSIGVKERVRFFLYRFADFIVPNSYSQSNLLKKNYPWMKSKIRTITNFVDFSEFYSIKRSCSNVPKILVVASASQSKNLHGYIEACRILRERNMKFTTEWYGLTDVISEYQNKAFELIKNYYLGDIFKLLPKSVYIANKYREADYFCLPSFYEGTPNALCEAIAVGLPIVCSNVCDNPIYVENGFNGYLFNPSEPLDMANKIQKLILLDNEKYQYYCENSVKIAHDKLAKETFINKYLEILLV